MQDNITVIGMMFLTIFIEFICSDQTGDTIVGMDPVTGIMNC